jgi:hypothetical protein
VGGIVSVGGGSVSETVAGGGKGARLTVIGPLSPARMADTPNPIDRISACASSDSSKPNTIRRLTGSCADV